VTHQKNLIFLKNSNLLELACSFSSVFTVKELKALRASLKTLDKATKINYVWLSLEKDKK